MRIERNHSLGKEEARQCVERIRADVADKYGLSTSWEGDILRVSGSGVSGHISVDEQRVVLDMKLGFAMMMLEGAIKSQISATMDEHLGQ